MEITFVAVLLLSQVESLCSDIIRPRNRRLNHQISCLVGHLYHSTFKSICTSQNIDYSFAFTCDAQIKNQFMYIYKNITFAIVNRCTIKRKNIFFCQQIVSAVMFIIFTPSQLFVTSIYIFHLRWRTYGFAIGKLIAQSKRDKRVGCNII